jgi:hypothetical protein
VHCVIISSAALTAKLMVVQLFVQGFTVILKAATLPFGSATAVCACVLCSLCLGRRPAHHSAIRAELTVCAACLVPTCAFCVFAGGRQITMRAEHAMHGFWGVLEWGANTILFVWMGIVLAIVLPPSHAETSITNQPIHLEARDAGYVVVLYLWLQVSREAVQLASCTASTCTACAVVLVTCSAM